MRQHRERGINPSGLQTPERDSPPLEVPESGRTLDYREPEEPEKDEGPERLAEAYRRERARRLDAVRGLAPDRSHQVMVWTDGRDAALHGLEEGQDPGQVKAMAPPAVVGCRDCWRRGRDAALRAYGND